MIRNKIPKTGICHRKHFGQYYIPKEIIVRIDAKQIWTYTVLDGSRMVITRKDVTLFMSRAEFNKNWEILEEGGLHWAKSRKEKNKVQNICEDTLTDSKPEDKKS